MLLTSSLTIVFLLEDSQVFVTHLFLTSLHNSFFPLKFQKSFTGFSFSINRIIKFKKKRQYCSWNRLKNFYTYFISALEIWLFRKPTLIVFLQLIAESIINSARRRLANALKASLHNIAMSFYWSGLCYLLHDCYSFFASIINKSDTEKSDLPFLQASFGWSPYIIFSAAPGVLGSRKRTTASGERRKVAKDRTWRKKQIQVGPKFALNLLL